MKNLTTAKIGDAERWLAELKVRRDKKLFVNAEQYEAVKKCFTE